MSDQPPILDTHQHLIYSDLRPYGWTKGIAALEGRTFHYDDYIAASSGSGISNTIFMESAPDDPHWKKEIEHVRSLSEQRGSLIRAAIANCRPESDDFAAYLDALPAKFVVGLRRILHVMPDEMSADPKFVENIRRLEARKLTFDLCFLARQLPRAIELAKKCPGVQMILDHCGVPDIAGEALDPWRENLKQLSRLPNVACKISGLPTYCRPDNAGIDAVRPYVLHAIDCFGPDRLVWGSDWPLVQINSSLPDWVKNTRELLSKLTPAEQGKILSGNARRIYRVPA